MLKNYKFNLSVQVRLIAWGIALQRILMSILGIESGWEKDANQRRMYRYLWDVVAHWLSR